MTRTVLSLARSDGDDSPFGFQRHMAGPVLIGMRLAHRYTQQNPEVALCSKFFQAQRSMMVFNFESPVELIASLAKDELMELLFGEASKHACFGALICGARTHLVQRCSKQESSPSHHHQS